MDSISLLLHLLVQTLHILHQQGNHLTLQLQTHKDEIQVTVLKQFCQRSYTTLSDFWRNNFSSFKGFGER